MSEQVHKVTLLIVDHDELGPEEVSDTIECTHYPNRCIAPQVMDIETREIEWTDEHPLNLIDRAQVRAEYERLFGKAATDAQA